MARLRLYPTNLICIMTAQGNGMEFTDCRLQFITHYNNAYSYVDSALGGVTLDSLPYLERLGFGGAAMLGGICSLAHQSDRDLCFVFDP